MRPIIEASLQNEYKLFINRLISNLKNSNTSGKEFYSDTFQYRFNENNYHAMLRGHFVGDIKSVHIVEVTNTIYFVADLDYKITNLYYDYWNATDLYRDIEELILDYVKYYGRTTSFISSSDKQTREDMIKAGIDKININDDTEVKRSAIYKTLLNRAKEVSNVSISGTLKSDVCKRLKERDNVIPIMWITRSGSSQDYVLNYPVSYLRSSNLMSDACRNKVDLSYLKSNSKYAKDITYNALVYTPYRKWLMVHMDKVSDEITHII